jgi:ABC-type Na+ efflux pump permease subunit
MENILMSEVWLAMYIFFIFYPIKNILYNWASIDKKSWKEVFFFCALEDVTIFLLCGTIWLLDKIMCPVYLVYFLSALIIFILCFFYTIILDVFVGDKINFGNGVDVFLSQFWAVVIWFFLYFVIMSVPDNWFVDTFFWLKYTILKNFS